LLAPQVEGVCIPLATFKPCDAGDMIEKIDYYLEHEQERELIRRACHEHVKNHDTYTHRARQILKIAGLS
jgi:spore maturation protein CgeB